MKIAKETTVAFTGYRTAKILRSSNEPDILQTIATELDKTVLCLHKQAYTTFLSGMSEGFDLFAAEAVLRARMKHPEIRLIAVIPFQGQELGYSDRDKERYKIIYELANEVIYTDESYNERAYLDRNDFLLDNSSVVVCYYDGQRGGTMYTVNRAKLRALPIINLHK
ncbi:hypothetical protein BN938_0701 [Mucinivorans hirudinis]|uniref:DUF1273 domain-containing protein n=1 Tax=Mucinivorans hirudinis TaxID=1433126 RepID=A0A060R6R5_9BACT|nr:hypothetical protein BN938_0701 [Mucinivorans hirudinis]